MRGPGWILALAAMMVVSAAAEAEEFGPFRYRIGNGGLTTQMEVTIFDSAGVASVSLCAQMRGLIEVDLKCKTYTPNKTERSSTSLRLTMGDIYILDRKKKALTVRDRPDAGDNFVVIEQGKRPWSETPVYEGKTP